MINEDYPYIIAWGKVMGSFPSYVQMQVDSARASEAPKDAIYRRANKWFTLDDVKQEQMKTRLIKIVIGK